MPKYKTSPDQNVLEFPGMETRTGARQYDALCSEASAVPTIATYDSRLAFDVVISGSYRKQFEALKEIYEQFRELGCVVLSPSSVSIVREEDGFVYMRGEETETPERIEERHLNAIQRASFVWLHDPQGYVGPTAALEIGYANAAGVPVYAQQLPEEKRFQAFVRLVESPAAIVNNRPEHPDPPAPALKAFQEYYRRAAIQRGYTKERPKDCLLLMVEEIGELARALRKREKLVRHGSYPDSNEAHELADVFLYVVHLANVLGLDLAEVVQRKEFANVEKFLGRK
jgi:NTP pyrophosphatase (non-canonical NTP hydrolase)